MIKSQNWNWQKMHTQLLNFISKQSIIQCYLCKNDYGTDCYDLFVNIADKLLLQPVVTRLSTIPRLHPQAHYLYCWQCLHITQTAGAIKVIAPFMKFLWSICVVKKCILLKLCLMLFTIVGHSLPVLLIGFVHKFVLVLSFILISTTFILKVIYGFQILFQYSLPIF